MCGVASGRMTGSKPPLKNPLERLTSGGVGGGLIRFAVGMLLVAGAMHFAGGDSLAHLKDPALLPVIALGAVIHLVQRVARIRKWQAMLERTQVRQRSLKALLRIQFIGMIANLVAPVSEALKIWAVSTNKADAKVATLSIVVDLAMHTCGIGVAGIAALALFGWADPLAWAAAAIMTVGGVGVVVVARVAFARAIRRPSAHAVAARRH